MKNRKRFTTTYLDSIDKTPEPSHEENYDIWQEFDRILKQFPTDIFSDLPKDLSINHDYYLYNTPKKSKDN